MMAGAKLDLWSLDECHFQQHGSRCVMWIPPEEVDPVLFHAPTRKQVGVYGAVRISNGQLVTQQATTLNAETFLRFLKKLLRHRKRGQQAVLISDNSGYHHASMLQPWLTSHEQSLRLDFLPPYSPELNPIERVWKLTRKRCVHNCYFPTLESLVTVVSDTFAVWSKPNESLRRLCAIN